MADERRPAKLQVVHNELARLRTALADQASQVAKELEEAKATGSLPRLSNVKFASDPVENVVRPFVRAIISIDGVRDELIQRHTLLLLLTGPGSDFVAAWDESQTIIEELRVRNWTDRIVDQVAVFRSLSLSWQVVDLEKSSRTACARCSRIGMTFTSVSSETLMGNASRLRH